MFSLTVSPGVGGPALLDHLTTLRRREALLPDETGPGGSVASSAGLHGGRDPQDLVVIRMFAILYAVWLWA